MNIVRKAGFARYLVLLLCLTALLSGCADLKGISSLAEISTATLKNTTFADDWVTSLERQKRYLIDDKTDSLDQAISNRKKVHASLLEVYQTASDYTEALGKLSSNDIISFTKSVEELENQLNSTKYLNGEKVFKESQVNACGMLAELLLKATTDKYRQDKLKGLIENSNSSFGIVIDTLVQFNNLYVRELENEKDRLLIRYQWSEKNELSGGTTVIVKTPVAILLEDIYYQKVDEVNEKIRSAQAYSRSLTKIKEAHQLLYDKRNDITIDEVRSVIKTYSQDINIIYSSLKH